jgi:AcrR family transcriptional regulator
MAFTEKQIEILRAASLCFAKYGYDKTTMDDIGKSIGLNKASLYYYYKNKESIYKEVILLETDDYIKILREKIGSISDCCDKIITYLIERFKYFKEKIILHKLSIEESFDIKKMCMEFIGMLYEKEIDFLSEIIEDCIKNKTFKECDTKKIADMLLSFSNGLKMKHIKCSDAFNTREIDYNALEEEIKYFIPIIIDNFKLKEYGN